VVLQHLPCLFRLVFVLWFPVKPGKCWLSSTSAAITYSAGWKEEEQAKEGERKKPFLNVS
jgi:hypothetical protein